VGSIPNIANLGGEIKYLRRLVKKEDKLWSAFNPSIAYSPKKGYAVTIRSSNYVILPHGELDVTVGNHIQNKVWFSELDENLSLVDLRQIDFSNSGYQFDRGVEDPKLLWRKGKWMFTAVAMERDIRIARHCECYLDAKATSVNKVTIYPGVDQKRPEKNWMTAGDKPNKFDYIYDGNGVIKDGYMTKKLVDFPRLSGIRGNTHLLPQEDGTYLAIVHRLWITRERMFIQTEFSSRDAVTKDYDHFLARFDENGWIIEISDPFKFISKGIEFAAGLVQINDDLVISFGKDDVSSHIAIINKNTLMKTMTRVEKV